MTSLSLCSLLLLASLADGAVAPKKTVVDEKIACNSDVHCSLMVKALTAISDLNSKVRTMEKNLTLKLVNNSKQTEKLSALLLFHDGRLKANIDSAKDETKVKVIKAISEVNSKVDKLEKNLNSKVDTLEKNLNSKVDKLGNNLNRKADKLENNLTLKLVNHSNQTEKLLKFHDERLNALVYSFAGVAGVAKLLQTCRLTKIGFEYAGPLSVTRSGLTCQPWNSDTPQYNYYLDSTLFPERSASAAGNKCRNPDISFEEGVWCYTTDPNTRWELCDVPLCDFVSRVNATK